MMVFIALPALQRSQRDTQRKNDMSRLVTQIINYQSNNRGALPEAPGSGNNLVVTTKYATGSGTKNGIGFGTSNDTWKKFYTNYLLAGSDTFEDPNGAPYQLYITGCVDKNGTTGSPCKASAQRENAEFEEGYKEGTIGSSTTQNYTVSIVFNAACSGEEATYVTGSRKVAVLYKNEGGGTICVNN